MKRYNDNLAPHEINKGFYRNIELGKDVVLQKIEISNQIRGMIVSHVGLASTSNTNSAAINASINLLAYDDRNASSGIYGLKASFEWNISEVVWQLEQNIQEFKDMIKILYSSQEPSYAGMRRLAQEDYENGRIADAIRNFLKLSQRFKDDFSVFLSLGLISLFHEKDKEKALEYFTESIEIARSQSDFYTSYVLLHKALVLRNLNRLEEAEEFSKQAVDLSPGLTEALYQNAQYSALLKKTDTAISLLKKIIRVDILYCLKIANERDFDGIRSHITKIFKEISTPYHESIKTKLKTLDKKLNYFDDVISSIHKQGLDISGNQNVKQRQEDRAELANMVDCDFVLNTFVVDYCLSQLDKNIRDDKLLLLSECKKILSKVASERKETAKTLKG
jgi:tetratricopeptide (TPR) repeat protein